MKYCHFILKKYFGSYINIVVGVHRTFVSYFRNSISSLCLLLARNTGAVDISWPVSTAIVSVLDVEKKVKAQTLVYHIMTALLVTPSRKNNAYSCPRLKKEKRELKKSSNTPNKDSASSSLIDPSSVTIVGAVDAQGVVKSPGLSFDKKKKKPNPQEKKTSTKHHKSGEEKPSKSPPQSHKSSADARIDDLDL